MRSFPALALVCFGIFVNAQTDSSHAKPTSVELAPGCYFELLDSFDQFTVTEMGELDNFDSVPATYVYFNKLTVYILLSIYSFEPSSFDSVKMIEGIDANVYKLAESQEGTIDTVLVETRDSIRIIQYGFTSSQYDDSKALNIGYWVYYGRYRIIMVQYTIPVYAAEEKKEEIDRFLKSLHFE